MSEWRPVRKRPVVVHVREVRPGENGIETLEGFKPCSPELHLILRGVHGEEYPIQRDIFVATYDYLDD